MPLYQRLPLRPVPLYLNSHAINWRRISPRQVRTMATKEQLQELRNYTACDISDALLKLKVPNCGFLPDLNLYTPPPASQAKQILIAPASTVLFAPKSSTDLSAYPEANIPAGNHYVDLTEPETIVVISQPKGQICAVLGGIMALRMKVLNAKGVVVHGRVRDVEELAASGLPVWGRGKSITGTGAEAKAHATQVPLDLDGTIVKPGDLVFSDSINGVIVIPQDKVSDLVSMLPGLVQADDRVKQDVEKGVTVQEAFKKHRG